MPGVSVPVMALVGLYLLVPADARVYASAQAVFVRTRSHTRQQVQCAIAADRVDHCLADPSAASMRRPAHRSTKIHTG